MAEPKIDTKVVKEPVKATTETKPASPPAKPASPKIPTSPIEPKKEAESKKDDAPKPSEKKEEEKKDSINMEIFNQILELDDDDDREFSKGMVWQYFQQVGSTFEEMDDELESKNLKRLSELGHFLKGSSAALGITKVQESCTKIQHYGDLRDEEKDLTLEASVALKLITDLLSQVKKEYDEAETWLRDWYKKNSTGGDPVLDD